MPGEQVIVALGFLSIVLGVPLAGRRVPRNRWYGLRVPATFADERIWYEANARCGNGMVLLGLVIVVVAAGLPMVAAPPLAVYAMVCTGVLAVGSSACVARGWRLANRLRRELGRDSSPDGG
jgi:uncharacterized membrane protein